MNVDRYFILIFYNRIFSTPRFHLISYCVGVFLVCWLGRIARSSNTFVNWLIGHDSIPLCINEYVMYDVYSATNLFTDLFILATPWPTILKLQMPRKKKIQLMGIFLLRSLYVSVSSRCCRVANNRKRILSTSYYLIDHGRKLKKQTCLFVNSPRNSRYLWILRKALRKIMQATSCSKGHVFSTNKPNTQFPYILTH